MPKRDDDRRKALVERGRQDCRDPHIRRSIVGRRSFLRCCRRDAKYQFITQMRTIGAKSTRKPDRTCVPRSRLQRDKAPHTVEQWSTNAKTPATTIGHYIRPRRGWVHGAASRGHGRKNEVNDVYLATKTVVEIACLREGTSNLWD